MTRETARARGLLARGGWIDVAGADGLYRLRLGSDRRARAAMALEEATFRDLVATPGLKMRPGGGWIVRPQERERAVPPPGSPGRIEGERRLMQADGQMTLHRANLGESPIAWLARRRDAKGRPFLTPAQFAAGERLRAEAEMALRGPSVTMRWDALPRTGGGSAARMEPSGRALSAARRVEQALDACRPHRAMVEAVCIHGSALQLAERAQGLRRREGKHSLISGLDALASHYRMG